jgi:hypothetical protein
MRKESRMTKREKTRNMIVLRKTSYGLRLEILAYWLKKKKREEMTPLPLNDSFPNPN